MNGNVVKRWDGFINSAGGPARIFPNGVVMAANGTNPPRQESLELVQRDFDGTSCGGSITTSRSRRARATRLVGASAPRLAAGGLSGRLLLAGSTPGDRRRQHADSDAHEPQRPNVADVMLEDDRLIEVSANGEIVWEWVASDHIDEFGFSAERGVRSRPRAASTQRGAVLTGCTSTRRPMSGRTAGSTKETSASRPNNVIISSRQASFLAIVGRDGKIVWRLGPDFSASKELRAIRQIIGQHHAHIIPKGLPGAGNLLVFDNGGSSGYGFAESDRARRRRTSMRAPARAFSRSTLSRWSSSGRMRARGSSARTSAARSDCRTATRLSPKAPAAGIRGHEGRQDRVGIHVSAVRRRQRECSNAVYRAYRVPYGWIPQLAMPKEQRVTPPALGDFRVSSSRTGKSSRRCDCTAERLGASVATSAIGEPVRSVTLSLRRGLKRPTAWRRIAASTGRWPRWTPTARRGRSTSASCCRRRGPAAPRSSAVAA